MRTDNSEQYGLIGKISRSGAPVIVASSEKVLPAFTEYDISRLKEMMTYMPKTVRSMYRAISILEKSDDSANDLTFLSDYFYSHYQEKYAATGTQTQRILSALSKSDSGLTLSEIRKITGQENGKISPYLKSMSDQKLINKEAKTPRGGIYSIMDTLFRLWLRHTM